MIGKTQAMDRLIAQDADLIDVPAMTDVEKNVIKLADHREPVVYTISVEHHWDGRVVAYVVDVSDDTRSKELVWDTLVKLVTDYQNGGVN